MVGARRRQPIQPAMHWTRVFTGGQIVQRQIPFAGEEKILELLPRNPLPLDYFKLYVTDEIIDIIVQETNLYAEQCIERDHETLRPFSLAHQWKPTNRVEMQAFLGLLILMGVVYKPRFKIYWSTDTLLSTPIFNQVINRQISVWRIYIQKFPAPPPPNRTKFFHFYICFHQKAPVSEVGAPSNEGWRPPKGKSWIRPCYLVLRPILRDCDWFQYSVIYRFVFFQ